MFKKIVGFAVVFAMLLSLATVAPAYGKPLSQMKDDLQTAKKKGASAQEKYNSAKAQEATLNSKIEVLEKNIATTEAQIDQLETEISKYEKQVTVITKTIKKLEVELTDQNSDLNARLRAMYMTDDQNIIEVLLGSANIIDFMANLDMVKEIHEQDVDVLDQMQAKLDEVEVQKAELVKVKGMIESSKKEQETKKANLDKNKKELDAQKQKVLAEADAAFENLTAAENEQANILAAINNYNSSVSGSPGVAPADDGNYKGGNGTLGWPCHGTITSNYGWRIHPVYGYSKFHNGLDIGVPHGTPIHAAADGVVISSGWQGGYGNTVMISHNSQLVTLYGHNSSLAVSPGQHVKRGQTIAYAGRTGTATGNHCHFEVRINGATKNPLSFL